MGNKLKKYFPLGLILLLAAVARFYQYDAWSLSNDELSAISRLRFDSLSELIKGGVEPDAHPAAIQVLLFYWSRLFGDSATALRLPFVLFGTLSAGFTYLIARRWFGYTPALFAGISMALLEFPVLYSQVARPYISGLFFVLVAIYLWDRLLFNDNKKWRTAVMLGFAFALAMYNHYFSFLTVLLLGITGLFYLSRNTRWPYFAAGLIAVILFLPHIPITLKHLSYGGVGEWLAKPSFFWIFKHVVYIFNESKFLLFASVSIVIASQLYAHKIPPWGKYHTISLILFMGVFLVGFLYSQMISAVLQHSTMIFVLPFFLFLIFSWISRNSMSKYLVYLLAFFLIIPPEGLTSFYQKQHFGEFQDIAATYLDWNREFSPHKISNALVVNDPFYIQYYFKRESIHFDKILHGNDDELEEMATFLAKTNHSMTCYAWTKPFNRQMYDIIRGYYPYIKKDKNYQGLSRITLFSNKEGTAFDSVFRKKHSERVLAFEDFEQEKLSFKGKRKFLSDSLGRKCYRVSAQRNFDLEFSGIFKLGKNNINELELKADIFSKKPLKKAMWVLDVTGPEGNRVLWKAIPLRYFTLQPDKWQEVYFTPDTYALSDGHYKFKVYIWNRNHETFLVDNMSVSAYE